MAPALSLEYSSQSGDGLEGLGWTLSGLPSIGRCPQTTAQDNNHGAINYNGGDRFCMEGQRLVATSGGTYGADGMRYRTEIDGFSRIISHGTSTGAGGGPNYFEVHTKSGQTMYFGWNEDPDNGGTTSCSTNCSRLTLSSTNLTARGWAVEKIVDTKGNFLVVKYVNDMANGQAYPIEIDYTGNNSASLATFASVKFIYSITRNDIIPTYQAGYLQQTTKLLTNIQTFVGTTMITNYTLNYAQAADGTSHDELTSITQCDSASNTNCVKTTSFGWQGSKNTVAIGSPIATTISNGAVIPFTGTVVSGDYNGDGLTDLIPRPTGGSNPCDAYLGDAAGDGSFIPGGYSAVYEYKENVNEPPLPPHYVDSPGDMCFPDITKPVQSLDFDADGFTDVTFETQPSGRYFLHNNGSGSFLDSTDHVNVFAPRWQVGDFNGDMRSDFFNSDTTSYTYISQGDGTFPAIPVGGYTGLGGVYSTNIPVDFDGDGCADVMIQGSGFTPHIHFFCNSLPDASVPNWVANGDAIAVGDFNGDGKADIFRVKSGTNAQLFLSNGTGINSTATWTHTSSDVDFSKFSIYTGDFNGDGKTDLLLIADGLTGHNGVSTSHQIWLSTGSSFVHAVDFANSGSSGDLPSGGLPGIRPVLSDWNSDGAADIWLLKPSGDKEYLISYQPELMNSVNNGMSIVTTVTYDRINKGGSLYQKCSTAGTYVCGTSYPTLSLDGAIYVVSRIDSTNGIATCNTVTKTNCYSSTYSYGGAQSDVSGRGFLGFSTMSVTDLQTGIVQTTTYNTLFPLTGLIATQTKVCPVTTCTSGPVTLNSITNTYDTQTLSSCGGCAPRTFVGLQTSVVAATDYDFTANTAYTMPMTTTSYTYDCDTGSCSGTSPSGFGNATTIAVSTTYGGSTSSKTTTNTYTNDTTNWFLGRLLTANVTSVVPGSTTATRHTSYCYSLSYTPAGTSCPIDATPDGFLTQEIMEPGAADPSLTLETDYTYDPFGNKASAVSKGCIWTSSSTCSTTVSAATRETDTAFSSVSGNYGQFLTKTTNALTQSENWTYATTATSGNGIPAAFGVPDTHTGPNGFVTNWTYDTFGRKTYEHRADKTFDTITYTDCTLANLPAGEIVPSHCQFAVVTTRQDDYYGSGDIRQAGPVTVTFYDGLSRVIAQDTEGYNRTNSSCPADTYCWIRVLTVYDANGRIQKASRPFSLNGGTAKYTVFTYDAIGRLLSKNEPGSILTTYEYQGLTTTVTNDAGQANTTVKNAQGLVASVQDNETNTTTYVYTVFGDLWKATDPLSHVTTYNHDLRGRKTSAIDPDMHTWTYVYDGFGELYSQTDPKSQTTTLTYDKLGRILTRTEPDLTSTYGYDAGTHGIGHLTSESATGSAAGSGVSRSYSYGDAFGRISSMTTTVDGTPYTYTYTYHSNGLISNVYYPSGFSAQFWQTNAGYAATMNDYNNGAAPILDIATRDADLHVLTETQGSGAINTTQTFDANTGRPLTTVATNSSTTIANQSYTFDSLGNLKQRQWLNLAGATVTERACYDDLNRLVTYKLTTSTICPQTGGTTVTVAYDALGNITSKSDICTAANCFTYGGAGAGPHALTAINGTYNGVSMPTFTYDQNGNMIAGGGRTITSTSFNMAAAVTDGANALALTYDGKHGRIKQVTTGAGAGTTYYLDDPFFGEKEEVFVAGGTTNWRDYLIDDGHMVGERFCTGATSPCTGTASIDYFVLDHLGSITVITNSSGASLETLNYDPWGKRRNADGTAANCGTITSSVSRGFTGQEMMDGVCYVNFNARVYDPSLGRFMSADPTTETFYDLQVLNRYSYVANNPLSLTDPTGLCFLGCFWNSGIFRAILAVAVAIVAWEELPALILADADITTTAGVAALAAVNGAGAFEALAITAGIAGGLAGAITGGGKGALLGILEGELFLGVGNFLQANPGAILGSSTATAFIAHGLVGGLVSALGGGKFGSGFLAAGLSSLAPSPVANQSVDETAEGATESAVLGGIGSILGGGKFANGAATGAFGYLFNDSLHQTNTQPPTPPIFSSTQGYGTPQIAAQEAIAYAKSLGGFDKLEYGGLIFHDAAGWEFSVWSGTEGNIPINFTSNMTIAAWWHTHLSYGGQDDFVFSYGNSQNMINLSRCSGCDISQTAKIDASLTRYTGTKVLVGAYLYVPQTQGFYYWHDPVNDFSNRVDVPLTH